MKDKTIIITGASSGIGKAMAFELAAQGSNLVLASRNIRELELIHKDLKNSPGKIMVIRTDVSVDKDCKAVVDAAIDQFGRIDILVNNAGISQRSLSKDTLIDVDRQLMNVNFFGSVSMTKHALPHMISQNNGHIVIVSSIVGKFGFPLRSGYAASKHALHGYFESLRAEVFQHNIHVTIVCPGRINTQISVNALVQDGSKYGIMDNGQAKGINAEQCAKNIIKAIRNRKKEVVFGGSEVNLVWIRRFFPVFFYKLIRKIKPV